MENVAVRCDICSAEIRPGDLVYIGTERLGTTVQVCQYHALGGSWIKSYQSFIVADTAGKGNQ